VGADRDLVTSTEAVLRAGAILGLTGVAVIHFSQVAATLEQTEWLGVSFVVLTMFCVVLAARLLHRRAPGVWAQVAVLNLATIGGYVFTRTLPTGFDNNTSATGRRALGWPRCSSRPISSA
jgi:hypothetical protein